VLIYRRLRGAADQRRPQSNPRRVRSARTTPANASRGSAELRAFSHRRRFGVYAFVHLKTKLKRERRPARSSGDCRRASGDDRSVSAAVPDFVEYHRLTQRQTTTTVGRKPSTVSRGLSRISDSVADNTPYKEKKRSKQFPSPPRKDRSTIFARCANVHPTVPHSLFLGSTRV